MLLVDSEILTWTILAYLRCGLYLNTLWAVTEAVTKGNNFHNGMYDENWCLICEEKWQVAV